MKTLLIVDDSAADVELLVEAFSVVDSKLTVITATDGDVGVEAIRRHKPDLVLLDLNMPRLSGLSVLNYVRADKRLDLIPLLVLSTSSSPDDRKRSIRAGARAYLTKPASYDETVELAKAVRAFWTRAK